MKAALFSLFLSLTLISCQQYGSSSRQTGNFGKFGPPNSGQNNNGGSTLNTGGFGGNSNPNTTQPTSSFSEEEQRQCDQIQQITENVQWNCYSLFDENAENISSTCLNAWDDLYFSGYCDVDALNHTIVSCRADLQQYYSLIPSSCKTALSPFISQ